MLCMFMRLACSFAGPRTGFYSDESTPSRPQAASGLMHARAHCFFTMLSILVLGLQPQGAVAVVSKTVLPVQPDELLAKAAPRTTSGSAFEGTSGPVWNSTWEKLIVSEQDVRSRAALLTLPPDAYVPAPVADYAVAASSKELETLVANFESHIRIAEGVKMLKLENLVADDATLTNPAPSVFDCRGAALDMRGGGLTMPGAQSVQLYNCILVRSEGLEQLVQGFALWEGAPLQEWLISHSNIVTPCSSGAAASTSFAFNPYEPLRVSNSTFSPSPSFSMYLQNSSIWCFPEEMLDSVLMLWGGSTHRGLHYLTWLIPLLFIFAAAATALAAFAIIRSSTRKSSSKQAPPRPPNRTFPQRRRFPSRILRFSGAAQPQHRAVSTQLLPPPSQGGRFQQAVPRALAACCRGQGHTVRGYSTICTSHSSTKKHGSQASKASEVVEELAACHPVHGMMAPRVDDSKAPSVNNGANEAVRQDTAAESAELRTASGNHLGTLSGIPSGGSLPCTHSLPSVAMDTRDTTSPNSSAGPSILAMLGPARGFLTKFKLSFQRKHPSEGGVEGGRDEGSSGAQEGVEKGHSDASSSGSLGGPQRMGDLDRPEVQVPISRDRMQEPPARTPGMCDNDRPAVTAHDLGLIHMDSMQPQQDTAPNAAELCLENPVFSESNTELAQGGAIQGTSQGGVENVGQVQADSGISIASGAHMHVQHASAVIHNQAFQLSDPLTNETPTSSSVKVRESTLGAAHGFKASDPFLKIEHEPPQLPLATCHSKGSKGSTGESSKARKKLTSGALEHLSGGQGGVGLADNGSETSQTEEHLYKEGDKLETLRSQASAPSELYSIDATSKAVQRWLMTTPSVLNSGKLADISGRYSDTVPDSAMLSQLQIPPLSSSLQGSPRAPPPEAPIDNSGSTFRAQKILQQSETLSHPGGSTSQLATVHERSASPLPPQDEAEELYHVSSSLQNRENQVSRKNVSFESVSMYTAIPTRQNFSVSPSVPVHKPIAQPSDVSGGSVERCSAPSDPKLHLNVSKELGRSGRLSQAGGKTGSISNVSEELGRSGRLSQASGKTASISQGLGDNSGADLGASAPCVTPKELRMSHAGTSGFFSANSSTMDA